MKTTFSTLITEYICFKQVDVNNNIKKATFTSEKQAKDFCKQNGYFYQLNIY